MERSEKFHGEIHLVLGILAGLLGHYALSANLYLSLIVGVIAAFLPDIDHIFFLFFYGRKTKYATEARALLLKEGVYSYIAYCKKNHKNNTGIISHNVATLVITLCLSFYFWQFQYGLWSVFFISFSFHFIFDMAEDLLFMGKLNSNWWLKFGSKS